jgi:hypothetical protein
MLEYMVNSNGHFSDYYEYSKVKTCLKHADFLVDIANKSAAISGSGRDRITITYSYDVAHFVDALVNNEERRPTHSVIIGEKVTMNRIVANAVDARVSQEFPLVHLTSPKVI